MKHYFKAGTLALAGAVCLPVWAQSNVTISGYLDAAVYKKTGSGTQMGSLGRNNLAFSGVEDLGGGLQATFRLSTRFEMGTGALETAPVGTRQYWQDETTVGLKGVFGSVRLGRALAPLNNYNWQFDPWNAFDRVASPMFQFTGPDFLTEPGNVRNPTGQDLDYTRLSNAIFYESPVFAGFQLVVDASTKKKEEDLRRGMAVAIRYNKGPLGAIVDHEINGQKDTLTWGGLSYKFDNGLALMGTYNVTKLNKNGSVYSSAWTNWAATTYGKAKRSSMTLGATYAMGAGTLRLGYGRDFQGMPNYFNYIGSSFNNAGTGYSGASNFYSVGYSYAFSKRTSVNASIARQDWKYRDDNGRRSGMGTSIGMVHTF